jgi:hypothetical protein
VLSTLPPALFQGHCGSRASAALGARVLLGEQVPGRVGLIGTGLINLEIARFLGTAIGAGTFLLHDLDEASARSFTARLGSEVSVYRPNAAFPSHLTRPDTPIST